MNVRRFDRRRVELSDAAMRALQTIAYLDHLTAGEALERLVMDFLELRWDEISEMEEAMPAPPARPPATVIDLETRRSRQGLERARQMRDVMQRSHALRAHSLRLCERARSMRTRARQQLRDADRVLAPLRLTAQGNRRPGPSIRSNE
jgi:hypothetical protein